MLFQISDVSVADSGTFSCFLSKDDTSEVSVENVIVAVFRRIEDKENLKQIESLDYFQSDQSETDFDLKYLKYEVNYSEKYGTSYLFCIICVITICWSYGNCAIY